MMGTLMQVYKRMPGSVRNVFASGYGYMMRARRYGPETRQLAKEALERESWSADRWQEYQAQQLTKLLDHAASNVPYYREHWRRRRARGDRSSHLELRNWPVLTKEELRQDAAQFLSDDRSGKLYEVTTSGSSGTPLRSEERRVGKECRPKRSTGRKKRADVRSENTCESKRK